MTMGMASEGIEISKLQEKPRRFLFSDVDEATLIRVFIENRKEVKEEEENSRKIK